MYHCVVRLNENKTFSSHVGSISIHDTVKFVKDGLLHYPVSGILSVDSYPYDIAGVVRKNHKLGYTIRMCIGKEPDGIETLFVVKSPMGFGGYYFGLFDRVSQETNLDAVLNDLELRLDMLKSSREDFNTLRRVEFELDVNPRKYPK